MRRDGGGGYNVHGCGKGKAMSNPQDICATFIGEWDCLYIDVKKVQAVKIEDMHERDSLVYRPLTQDEKLEVISLSLRYGSRGILYWAFKALILWWTKEVYPQQGGPESPPSNFTRMFPFFKPSRH